MNKGMIAVYLILVAIGLSIISISILPWFIETREVEGNGAIYEMGWGLTFRESKDIKTDDMYLLTCLDCPNLEYYSLQGPPEDFFCNETITNENATEGICDCCECSPEEMERVLIWKKGDVNTNIAPLSNSVYQTLTYEQGFSNRLVVSERAENILVWGLYSIMISFIILLGFQVKLFKHYSQFIFVLISSVLLISAPIYYVAAWPDAIDNDYVASGDEALGMGFQGTAVSQVNSSESSEDLEKINITYNWSPGPGWFVPIIAGLLGFFSVILMGMQLRDEKRNPKKRAIVGDESGETYELDEYKREP